MFQVHAKMVLASPKTIRLSVCVFRVVKDGFVTNQLIAFVCQILVNMDAAGITDLHQSHVLAMQVTLAYFVKQQLIIVNQIHASTVCAWIRRLRLNVIVCAAILAIYAIKKSTRVIQTRVNTVHAYTGTLPGLSVGVTWVTLGNCVTRKSTCVNLPLVNTEVA